MSVGTGCTGGTAYTDASPRQQVTAGSVADLCWRCTWSCARAPEGGYVWSLKCVHAGCPEHGHLSRSGNGQSMREWTSLR
jgi:hypothetical protein